MNERLENFQTSLVLFYLRKETSAGVKFTSAVDRVNLVLIKNVNRGVFHGSSRNEKRYPALAVVCGCINQ